MSSTEVQATQTPELVDQAVETHENKKSPQDSFAELRKAKEDLERQLWQAEQEKKFYEKQLNQQQQFKQTPPPVPEEEEFDFRSLEQEDFPDGKKLVKAFNSVQKKMSAYETKLAEKENVIRALQIQQEFPDFREVVTADNIEKYIKSDEDNREAVETARDPLRKVYNLIKKSAAYQADKVKSKPISQEQQRVDEKESKPKSSSIGVRSEAVTVAAQMSNSRMTRDQKNALWKETVQAAKK
jgi:hypothetical protein